MGEALTPLRALSEQEQVAYFYSRSRTRSFRDPAKGLYRTHVIDGGAAIPVATIDTDVLFPIRDRQITLVTEIETGVTPTALGIVWEFGSSVQGAKLAINDDTIFLAGGNAAGDEGVDGSIVVPALQEDNACFLLTVAITPGAGEMRLFIDATLVLRLNGVDPFTNDEWADTEDGSLGSAEATSSTQRGQTLNGAPVDFTLIRPLSVFQGQIPRQFD